MHRNLIVLLILAVAVPAAGATIRVERDGSGDYQVIQAAVDAAASGDTIRIGPGRYNEGAMVTCPGWTEFVRVLVRQDELTLIGAGPDQTIIGPTTQWSVSQGWNKGIESGPWWGSHHVWISDMGFENMAYAVCGSYAPDATIRNCRFSMNNISVWYTGSGVIDVSACTFSMMPRNGHFIGVSEVGAIRVTDCSFTLAPEHTWTQEAVHLESVPVGEVSRCVFVDGQMGLGLYGMGSASVVNCVFSGQSAETWKESDGIYISGGSVSVAGCVFEHQRRALGVDGHPSVQVLRSQILDVSESSINFASFASLEIHECVIAHGPRYAVWQAFPCDMRVTADLPHLDMTNNDWGTSSVDSIASWIRSCEYVVDYVPFKGQPVPAESTNWGDLKSLFR